MPSNKRFQSKVTERFDCSCVDKHKFITKSDDLLSETVDGASVAFQGVDDVHGGHGLAVSVLGVSGGIAKDLLEEGTEGSTALVVDLARDTLDSSTARETTKSRLGDSSDGLLEGLTVTITSSLSETLSSLSTSRHVVELSVCRRMKKSELRTGRPRLFGAQRTGHEK